MIRLPLEQRLKIADRLNPNALKIFDMKLFDFLSALTAIVGKEEAESVQSVIDDHAAANHTLGVAIAARAGLFDDELDEVDYALLVEAFAKISQKQREKYK
ncbi:hypothetical protein LJC34_01975 [Oscillospiraceae bacterium OttesenSCG-928-G22]|nr:hypothetical protein [Oscillospiraceae bacterium OttesenSCG-928-G22]